VRARPVSGFPAQLAASCGDSEALIRPSLRARAGLLFLMPILPAIALLLFRACGEGRSGLHPLALLLPAATVLLLDWLGGNVLFPRAGSRPDKSREHSGACPATQEREAGRLSAALSRPEQGYGYPFDRDPMRVYGCEPRHFLGRDEFMAMTIKALRRPEDVPPLLDRIAKLPPCTAAFSASRHRRKDGTLVEVADLISHALRFRGRNARIVLVNDITERRHGEAALPERERQHRQLFEHNPMPIPCLRGGSLRALAANGIAMTTRLTMYLARLTAVVTLSLGFAASACAAQPLPLQSIRLPNGFEINLFADNIPNARSLALGGDNTVFIGTRTDKVYAVKYRDGKATQVFTIASGLNMPNGVAFRDGSLYVAEINRVVRFDNIEAQLAKPPQSVVVSDKFPSERQHGWKFIAFGPDGWLYVPVGAPCNICEPDASHANIMRMKPDGSNLEVFARGVRNSVGFDWDPAGKGLWFTDNGRDAMGDEIPSDELNHAPRPGMHFGYPYCHQGDLADPEYGAKHGCGEFTPPAAKLGPHVAALGIRFYTGDMFPAEYRNNIIVAEHGSWNRSRKIGYRLVRVIIKDDKVERQEIFAEGWLQGEQNWGRPVDVLVMPDGAILVSDDQAGVIYRITYRSKTS